MSIWKHDDARAIMGGCLGFVILLVAAALMLPAWFRSEPVPLGVWLMAGVGVAIIVWYVRGVMAAEQRIAAYQKRRNEMANAIRDAVLAGNSPGTPYFVYLRPFDIDQKFVEAPRMGVDRAYVEEYGWPASYHDLESALALLVYPFGKLVALSDEEGKAGAGYVRSTDLTWQREVQALCEHARGIFVVPFDFEGTAWEVEMLTEFEWLGKTFFVMPASSVLSRRLGVKYFSRNYSELWEAGRARYRWLNLPEYDDSGAILQVDDGVRVLMRFGSAQPADLKTLHTRLKEISSASKSP